MLDSELERRPGAWWNSSRPVGGPQREVRASSPRLAAFDLTRFAPGGRSVLLGDPTRASRILIDPLGIGITYGPPAHRLLPQLQPRPVRWDDPNLEYELFDCRDAVARGVSALNIYLWVKYTPFAFFPGNIDREQLPLLPIPESVYTGLWTAGRVQRLHIYAARGPVGFPRKTPGGVTRTAFRREPYSFRFDETPELNPDLIASATARPLASG
jgi:hypothetical protein